MKNKFNFYMIAVEEINGETIGYGVSWNLKNEIQWKYSFDTGQVELVESIAGPQFHTELLEHIENELPAIREGKYEYSPSRVEEAKRLIVGNAYNTVSYLGK